MRRVRQPVPTYVPVYVPVWYGKYLKTVDNGMARVRSLEAELSGIDNKMALIPRSTIVPSPYQISTQGTAIPQTRTTMPTEMLGEISRRADLRTTLNLSQASRAARDLLTSDRYWISRIQEEFPDEANHLAGFLTAGLKYPVIYRLLRDYKYGEFTYTEHEGEDDERSFSVFTPTVLSVIKALKNNDVAMIDYCITNRFFKWFYLTDRGDLFDVIPVLALTALEAGAYEAYEKIRQYAEDAQDFEEPDNLSGDVIGELTYIPIDYVTSDVNILRTALEKWPRDRFDIYLTDDSDEEDEGNKTIQVINLAIKQNAPDIIEKVAEFAPGTVERLYQESKVRFELLSAGLNK